MKTKLYIALVTIFTIALSPAQELFPKTDGQRIVAQIDSSQSELLRHIESQLNSFYSLINTAGKQQEILDAFGTKAVTAMEKYMKMRAALLEVNPNAKVPTPNLTIFKPNADGTVTYVAPPIVVDPPVTPPTE